MSGYQLIQADARAIPLADGSISAVVTDPPYGLAFMGKAWDYQVPGVDIWREVKRVMKPGAHAVIFGGSRTHHRMACAVEDAGLEIRDCLMWLYGSGFPKSLDISKALDKAAGAAREVVAIHKRSDKRGGNYHGASEQRPAMDWAETLPTTEAAHQWQGWGTALKPAHEPIILARKPLEGTVVANVQAHGCGGLNIDACRVNFASDQDKAAAASQRACRDQNLGRKCYGKFPNPDAAKASIAPYITGLDRGRWPANVLLDEESAAMLDAQSGYGVSKGMVTGAPGSVTKNALGARTRVPFIKAGDSGGASRFFYTAKASPGERGEGNTHPTVKPLALMEWLITLVAPPDGILLDPFVGSGTTCRAADRLGRRSIGLDLSWAYLAEIAAPRLAAPLGQQAAKAQAAGQLALLEGVL